MSEIVSIDAYRTAQREVEYWKGQCAVAWLAGVAIGALLGAVVCALWRT